jgi:RHS repeat-associated protein
MMRRLSLAVTLMLSLAGAAAGQVTSLPAGQGRYLVELTSEAASSGDARTLVSELAATYGGSVEPQPQAGRFVIDMLPARAELLGRDSRVTRITEARQSQDKKPENGRAVPNGNGSMSWAYSYDGAGNIATMGADSYAYDTANRLIRATVGGTNNTMAYQYDAPGNRTVATAGVSAVKCVGGTDCDVPVTISTSTNHLTGSGITYDPAGNLTALSAVNSFTYDALSMVQSSHLGSNTLQYIYTADDERVATYSGGLWTWTIRDLGAHPLREYTSGDAGSSYGTANLTWSRDSIWRGVQLLASEARRSASDATVVTEHFHLDHLGTPRLITDNAWVKLATHTYYPFGAELDSTAWEQPEAQLKFTGHMRDTGRNGGLSLDDMHARYFSANLGRFLTMDSKLDAAKAARVPQRWNQYVYALNNPVKYIDENGREITIAVKRNGEVVNVNVRITVEIHNADGPRPSASAWKRDLQGAANILGGVFTAPGHSPMQVTTTIDAIVTDKGNTDRSRHQLTLDRDAGILTGYADSAEQGGNEATMGVVSDKWVAHEFAHWLGLPDDPEIDPTSDQSDNNLMNHDDSGAENMTLEQWLEIMRAYRAGELNQGISPP